MECKGKSHGGVERGSELKQASDPPPTNTPSMCSHNHISNGGRTGRMRVGGGGGRRRGGGELTDVT